MESVRTKHSYILKYECINAYVFSECMTNYPLLMATVQWGGGDVWQEMPSDCVMCEMRGRQGGWRLGCLGEVGSAASRDEMFNVLQTINASSLAL